MKKDEAVVEIFRFDEMVDKEPRFEKYRVPYREKRIIDILRYVYERFDPTLAYRESCNSGVCGCCTIMVNGRPILPCMELAEDKMRIEPLPNHKIIRDLVVDQRSKKEAI